MMDIDDILRDAERDLDPLAADAALMGLDSIGGSGKPSVGEADLQALTRAWVNERGAPEVLPWPKNGLIERCMLRIKTQIETVEVMTGDMDPKTNFGLIVIQTELERWKYLIRSLLRARMAKVDAHALHYLSTPALIARLSPAEIDYATRHQQLIHHHYLSSFLASFPEKLQDLNDTAGGISMIDGPDEDSGVFVRVIGFKTDDDDDDDYGAGIGRHGGGTVVFLARGRDVDKNAEVERGEVVIARWADVRDMVESGVMELV